MFHRTVVLIALILALAGLAAADTLHLKNGRSFDGRLISETGSTVVFEIRGVGKQTFKKSDVDRIEEGASIFDEYDARKAKVDEKDPDALFDLGKWCVSNGLRKEARLAYRAVIRLDTDHRKARAALGYVPANGKWLTRKDFRKYQAKRKAELEKVLGSLKLGRQHKNPDDVICFRAPRGWKKDESPDGLGICFLGPELHGVTLVVGYEVACPADLDLFKKGVRREIEGDEEEFELVRGDAMSDLGGRATKASVVRYGAATARAERIDIYYERDEDVVHVWFICPAEDVAALSGLFSEVRSSFMCDDVESMMKAGEFRFELPDEDWVHGWGALSDIPDIEMPEPEGKVRVIGHTTNPTFIMIGSERGGGDADAAARAFIEALFTGSEGSRLSKLPDKSWTRKISDATVTIHAFSGTFAGSIAVDGYACAFVKGKRVYFVLSMNLLGSMSRKYLRKDLNTLLDSLKIG